MANETLEPVVPVPAPAAISPVGFSSTIISIILNWSDEPSFIFVLTVLKIFVDFMLLTDLLNNISLNASPSSVRIEFLITFSLVL